MLRVFAFLLVLAVSIGFSSGRDCGNEWKYVQANGPAPEVLSAHSLVAYQESLYVFAGFLEAFAAGVNTFYNVLYRFNTDTESWTIVDDGSGSVFNPHPTPRAYHAAVVDPDTGFMYVYGGIQYNADFSVIILFDELWRWDFTHGGWTLLSTGRGAGPKADHAMTISNGKLYIFGGIKDPRETDTGDLWEYDIATDTWILLTPDGQSGTPVKRHNPRLHASTLDGNLYLNAGQQVDTSNDQFSFLNDTWAYNIAAGTWTNLTPALPANNFNPSTTYAAHVLNGDTFAVYGGDFQGGPSNCGAPAPQLVVNQTWVFDTSRRPIVWKKLTFDFTPPPIKRGAAALIGDCMYIHGGWDFPFCPPGQVWNNFIWNVRMAD